MDAATHPCPACGYLVFSRPVGSREHCGMCGWIDDHIQLHFPGMVGGLNTLSLWDWQQKVLVELPPEEMECGGVLRDPSWRPLREGEASARRGVRIVGRMYVDIPGAAYYWHDPASATRR